MSLQDFQAAWATLLLDQQQRERWHQGTFDWPGLSATERDTLQAIPEQRLDAIASAAMRGRREVYFRSLPKSVQCLLPEAIGKRLAAAYALTFPEKDLHPRHLKFPEYLFFLKQHLPEGLSPHLPDILSYEAVAASLVFYRLPVGAGSKPAQAVPNIDENYQLAPSAGLLVAGSHLEEVLKHLRAGQTKDNLPITPREGYLLQRTPTTVLLTHLHWAVFEILRKIDGQRSWETVLEDLIQEEPVLAGQKEQLLAWEGYFVKKGILYSRSRTSR